METTLDRFGRIVIPKKIRNDLNLEVGSRIRIEKTDHAIILKAIEGEPSLRWKDGVLVFSGSSVGDIGGALAGHRKERMRHLQG